MTNSAVKNGPLPTMGSGLVKLVSASFGVTLLHTCSGRMGMKMRHMSAFGREHMICTVVGSSAFAPMMPRVARAMLNISFLTM